MTYHKDHIGALAALIDRVDRVEAKSTEASTSAEAINAKLDQVISLLCQIRDKRDGIL